MSTVAEVQSDITAVQATLSGMSKALAAVTTQAIVGGQALTSAVAAIQTEATTLVSQLGQLATDAAALPLPESPNDPTPLKPTDTTITRVDFEGNVWSSSGIAAPGGGTGLLMNGKPFWLPGGGNEGNGGVILWGILNGIIYGDDGGGNWYQLTEAGAVRLTADGLPNTSPWVSAPPGLIPTPAPTPPPDNPPPPPPPPTPTDAGQLTDPSAVGPTNVPKPTGN